MDQNTNDVPTMPPPQEELQQGGDINSVKFIDFREESWFSRYKYILITITIFIVLVIIQMKKDENEGARDILISGTEISLTLDGSLITANLVKIKSTSFLINNAWIKGNTGSLAVIPMDKVKYIEKKYNSDFMNCGSDGAEEGKNSTIIIGMIANNALVEMNMNKIAELAEKRNMAVIEIAGSQLKDMQGLTFIDVQGTSGSTNRNYYLVDSLNIISENYNK